MLAGVMINAYGRIDLLLLRAFTDAEAVGHYSFAYRMIDLAAPLSFLFVSSVYPLLAEYHATADIGAFRTLYQRSHDFLSLAGMGLATGVILFAPNIVDLLGGAEYGASVTVMRVLAMTFALIWLTNLVNHSLISVGKQNVLLWTACLALVVNVSANLIMIPIYGKEGAAATQALTEATVLSVSLVVLSRYMGDAPSFWVAGRLLPVVGVSAIVVYALPLPWVTEVLLTGVLFGIGIALARIVKIEDIRQLLKREPEGARTAATAEMRS
jgi:O-antigen/teichoic acid export membrane protein